MAGLLLLVGAGCSSDRHDMIGDGAIGVDVTHDCAVIVYASATEGRPPDAADEIAIAPGDQISIDLLVNAASDPTRFFLFLRPASSAEVVVVEEYPVDRPRDEDVEVTFQKDCSELAEDR